MKTVRKLLHRDIIKAVSFVMLAFLSLFFFLDFIDELDRMGREGAGAAQAAYLCLLKLPHHFYELFPIGVLIGSVYSLARFAQSSEFTILRTGGLGPGRALGLLSALAAVFALITLVTGDLVAPHFEQEMVKARAQIANAGVVSKGGAWLKDRQSHGGDEFGYTVHVERARADGTLENVRIFEFDTHGALLTRATAATAQVDAAGHWTLQDAHLTRWSAAPTPLSQSGVAETTAAGKDGAGVKDLNLPTLNWHSSLGTSVISAAVLPVWSMSTWDLYRYAKHLSSQDQSAQVYSIQFWRKATYPFACLVMMALALPFAYLHGRSGGISFKVFGGIMLGISFVLLNHLAGHLGILKDWTPWAVAAVPSLLYLGLSLAAFAWLVRYR